MTFPLFRLAGWFVPIATLIASMSGCGASRALTIDSASQTGSKQLARLQSVLAEHHLVVEPWHASGTTSPFLGCPEEHARWVGLATMSVNAWTGDGDYPGSNLSGRLLTNGWETGAFAGDMGDDPASAVPAVPTGRNPAGLMLTVTIERVRDTWRYTVNIVSGCARY